MTTVHLPATTVAEAYLALLKARGIDRLLANAGTDFAPLIEAFARGAEVGIAMPEPLAIPHETVALGMAHGLYLATGRPQAVMVHVSVGLANALMGIINAARDDVPILVTAGRTPITEAGMLGSRDLPIHWGQEMFDQAGMLREVVKWDYELRLGAQVENVVDRALAIAMGAPRGPVHLSLPREVLAAPLDGFGFAAIPGTSPAAPAQPDPDAIARAAALLSAAERPLIIAGRGDATTFAPLAAFAERFAIPVAHFWPSRLAMATDHPLHAGFDPAPWLGEADAILTLDAMVPWLPSRLAPPPDCPVIQMGPDPLFARLPMRAFRATVTITTAVAAGVDALAGSMAAPSRATDERRESLARRITERRTADRAAVEQDAGAPITADWVAHCLDQIKGDDAVVVSELGCGPASMTFTRPGTFFAHALAGGLGWGLPAALGIQLADPGRLAIATVGDGSYQFANPVACHQVAEALGLPVLTIVLNDGRWNAVRKSTLAVYPDGHAARANRLPLTSLEPSPAYEEIARASRGFGERVEDGRDLPAALTRALHAVRTERRQALLNVICA